MGYQQDFSKRLAESLRRGIIPWRKPVLRHENAGPPTNAVTGRKYSGINSLVLDCVAAERGYHSKWWATYNQWRQLGLQVSERPHHVPEGSWGVPVVSWGLKHSIHKIFNAQQVIGLDVGKYLVPYLEYNSLSEPTTYQRVWQFIQATGARIVHHEDGPLYHAPPDDYIAIPVDLFANKKTYYSSVLHELIHWTQPRIGWFGDDTFGELVCEIGTGFLENELCLSRCPDLTNHNKYLPAWLRAMEDNANYIFKAAAQANRATRYLLRAVPADWEEFPE